MHMGAHACAQRREASIDQAPLAFSSDRDKRLVASMTNLWMDPAVDAASERPVAATAGLWMAEATDTRPRRGPNSVEKKPRDLPRSGAIQSHGGNGADLVWRPQFHRQRRGRRRPAPSSRTGHGS